MRTLFRFPRMIAATLVAAIAFSLTLWPVHAETSSGRRVTVEIQSFKFAPRMPDVRPGDTVVWVNKDIVPHTVTARDKSWDSGTIKAGARWEVIVTPGMSPAYFCRFHPSMTARIRIGRGG